MSALPLPGFQRIPERPTRRPLWADAIRRLATLLDDQRARDRQRHDAELDRLKGQVAELRTRMCDLERHAGLADIGRASRRSELRRYAGGRA